MKRYLLAKTIIVMFIVALAAVMTATVFAATTGKIAGYVKDEETKQPIANVKVIVLGMSLSTLTNKDGYYVFTNVSPGDYEVKVEHVGYGPVTKAGVKVLANLTTAINFDLKATLVEIEGITETAAKPLVKKDETETTRIVESEQITEMPRDNIGGIVALQPGVTETKDAGGSELHIRGGRSMEIKYLLDGIPLDDPILKGQAGRVNVNAVEEMEVVTGGFNAEHGNAQSGIINIITKEGTQKFTGRLEYRFGMFVKHHGDALLGTWYNPEIDPNEYKKEYKEYYITQKKYKEDKVEYEGDALEIFRGIFLGEPRPHQQPYRGQDVTVKDLMEQDEPVEFVELLPGVYADSTENPLVTDPETGETKKEPYKDTDGTLIDYENKKVTLPDGYVVDLKQYEGLFNDTKDYDLKPSHIGQFSLSGPIWENKLTFSLNSELRRSGDFLPNDELTGRVFQGKLKAELTPNIKLAASGLYNYSWSDNYGGYVRFGDYGGDWRFNPEVTPVRIDDTRHYTLKLSHNLSSATFYNVSLGMLNISVRNNQLRNKGEDNEEEVLWNPFKTFEENIKNIKDVRRQAYNDTNYVVAGDFHRWSARAATVTTLKADLTSQVTPNHQVKTGGEFELKDMARLDVIDWGSTNMYVDVYGTPRKIADLLGVEENEVADFIPEVKPKSVALYAQDKMEFESMIVNLGLRFDLYDPSAKYPGDSLDPIALNDDGTVKLKKDTPEQAGVPIINNPQDASIKYQISPRLGISYPITERNKLHFTYGHYFQIPRAQDLYENLNYDMRGAIRRMGNPDLEPEKTVAYEVGVEHQFTDDLLGDVTWFSKDINNLVDSEHVTPKNAANDYSHFKNGIYGRAQGVEITLQKRRTEKGWLSGFLSYTYSVAKGKGSSRNSGYLTYYNSQPPITESWPLDWDQRHVISVAIDLRLPYGFGLNSVGQFGSGLPYTPNPENPVKPAWNSKRYPPTYNVDAVITKKVEFAGMTYSLFTEILNVFNTRNLVDIIDPVTYDRYGRPLNDKKHTDPLAYDAPRQIMFGASVDW
ncbi:TonB-dependent receptor [Candidatus Poribacteria bacterium]|nr:TonB-dependent receptor [Candidatus Poribacteria bacterium]